MAQSSPEGIVFDKDSALIKMEISVNEEPILEVGKDTVDYIDKHIVEAMAEVANNEITLEDVFNDEKKKSLKKFIDKHKQETFKNYPVIIVRNDDKEEFIHLSNGMYRTKWGILHDSISSTPLESFDKSKFTFYYE